MLCHRAAAPPLENLPPCRKLGLQPLSDLSIPAGSLSPRLGPEWEAGDGPPHAKAPKTIPSTELPQEAEEEAEEAGLFIPVGESSSPALCPLKALLCSLAVQ